MGQIIVGRPGGLASVATFETFIGRGTTATIRNNTSDGADNASLLIAAGGLPDTIRGAFIDMRGNEVVSTGGRCFISGGNVATGHVTLATFHSSAVVEFRPGGSPTWTMDINGDILQNASNGRRILFSRANQTFNFAGTMATSSATVGTTAVANWIECLVAGVSRFIPSYAA